MQRSAPVSPQMEVRTEIPSALVPTPTSAPSQPPAELRGRCGKQQHGVGEQCPGREKRERAGCGRRTSQTPRRSPTEPVPPRSPTLEHSSAAPSAGWAPLLPSLPWAARNQTETAQPTEGDRECRRPSHPRPPPQLPTRIAPDPPPPPTAKKVLFKHFPAHQTQEGLVVPLLR